MRKFFVSVLLVAVGALFVPPAYSETDAETGFTPDPDRQAGVRFVNVAPGGPGPQPAASRRRGNRNRTVSRIVVVRSDPLYIYFYPDPLAMMGCCATQVPAAASFSRSTQTTSAALSGIPISTARPARS